MRLAVLDLPDLAARAAVMGADVAYAGLDPARALTRTARALPGLYDRTPPEGRLRRTDPEQAASGADLVLRPAGTHRAGEAPNVAVGAPDDDAAAALYLSEPAHLVPEIVLTGPAPETVALHLAQIGLHPVETLGDWPAEETACTGLLRALRAANHGAGRLIAATEALWPRPDPDWSGPVETADRVIPLDWVDYNGHMTEARYLHAFGDATDRLMQLMGCTPAYVAAGHSFFTAETHIRHLGEAKSGDRIRIESRAIRIEGAKLHIFHAMRVADRLVATAEHFLLHVSLTTRRPVPPVAPLDAGMARFAAAALPPPDGAGRFVGQPR